jgi:hypothetical protein
MRITSVQFGIIFYMIFAMIWYYIWFPYGNVGFFTTIVGMILLAAGTVHYFHETYPIDCPPECDANNDR